MTLAASIQTMASAVWAAAVTVIGNPYLLIGAAMFALGSLIEFLVPAREKPAGYSIRTNLSYFSIIQSLNVLFFWAVQAWITTTMLGWIGAKSLLDLSFGASGSVTGSIAALLVSMFIVDFFFYFWHRSQHVIPFLWQTHWLHHSDEHINVTTTPRAHFIEGFFAPILTTVPMTVLFNLPTPTIIWMTFIPVIYIYFVHVNVRVGFGPFWWLITSPQYHRLHHSIEIKHRDKNFAAYFPILDIVFGTAYKPAKDEYPLSGVDEGPPVDIKTGIAQPFVGWLGMLKQIASKALTQQK